MAGFDISLYGRRGLNRDAPWMPGSRPDTPDERERETQPGFSAASAALAARMTEEKMEDAPKARSATSARLNLRCRMDGRVRPGHDEQKGERGFNRQRDIVDARVRPAHDE